MKQQITKKQLEELNDVQKKQLRQWLTSKDGITGYYIVGSWDYKKNKEGKKNYSRPRTIHTLSIGEMIEFLDYSDCSIIIDNDLKDKGVTWHTNIGINNQLGLTGLEDELCDALWESVKEVLSEV